MRTMSVKATMAREAILKRIVRGRMKPGDRIPSEMQLASDLKMNHQTVRRGLAQLVEEGVIVKQAGVGNFVKPIASLHVGTPIAIVMPASYLQMKGFSPAGLIYDGASRVLSQRDYNISVLTFGPWKLWDDAGQPAIDRGIRGMLVVPAFCATAGDIARLKSAGVPMVMLSYAPEIAGAGVGWVDCDVAAILLQLIEGLIARGHKRITVYQLTNKNAWAYEESVIRQAQINRKQQGGAPVMIELRDAVPFDVFSQQLGPTLDAQPEVRPSAVIVPDEIFAIEAFRVCYARGLRVPQDLAIAALQDHMPHAHPVPLTAMNAARHMSDAAAAAARELTKLLDGEEVEPRGIVLPAHVDWKASTGLTETSESKLRKPDPAVAL
jgi:GntR family transcriptional regulator of arabinose operon